MIISRIVLKFDVKSLIVTVSGFYGKFINTAVEDIAIQCNRMNPHIKFKKKIM